MSSSGTFSAENPADFAATASQDPSIAGRSPDAHFNRQISWAGAPGAPRGRAAGAALDWQNHNRPVG
jgi:hypothetical protein